MPDAPVTTIAAANIAFIKYWGNVPPVGNQRTGLNLPLNPSISMTLSACVSRTTLALAPEAEADDIHLGGRPADAASVERISAFLDIIRERTGRNERTCIRSANSFPTGAGIASSASGFAALALAAATAYGLDLDDAGLSCLARRGSGSAARSVLGGFVELCHGDTDETARALQIAPEADWPDLRDVVVIVSKGHKGVSSANGHLVAHTSEMMKGRLEAVTPRAEQVRRAILDRDLTTLGEAAEADALSMHAVMMTSTPALLYWSPETIAAIQTVWDLRADGVEAWFTIDAGPNVHVMTTAAHQAAVETRFRERMDCDIIVDQPGAGARIVEDDAT